MSPFWRDNYKAMSAEQLQVELKRLTNSLYQHNPSYYKPRIAFIREEILIKGIKEAACSSLSPSL